MTAATLAGRVIAGDIRAIARAITVIENEDDAAAALVAQVFPHTGRAYLIGVTGPPGAGKSTLVDRLIEQFRSRGRTVGVIAVDPTSPFTGGAVLGDRVRMQQHAADTGVFVRSMATRGHLGGLSRTTADAALVLDAGGKDIVIIETVGVGQDEVEIMRTADVSLVTLVPGTGDDVQAIKAGIMEIADIFVVNKADREGTDRLVTEVESNLSLGAFHEDQWRPPILKTIATAGEGIDVVVDALERFQTHETARIALRRRQRGEHRLRDLLSQRFMRRLERYVLTDHELVSWVDRIARRDIDPYSAADALIARAFAADPEGR